MVSPETNLELEYKFDVDTDFDPPDLSSLVARIEPLADQSLTTTYYDTADFRLWAQGITLRHRAEAGGDAGKWTLKLPLPEEPAGEQAARSEVNWKGDASSIPDEARAVVAGLARRQPLEPVATLSAERRRTTLQDDAGHGWAEVDDDVVTVTAGRRQGLRFRQIEVELTGESGGEIDAVVRELRRAGVRSGGSSKFALAAGVDEDVSRDGPVARLLDADWRLRVPGAGSDAGAGMGPGAGGDAGAGARQGAGGATAGPDVAAVRSGRAATSRVRHALDPAYDPPALRRVHDILGRMSDEDAVEAWVRRGARPTERAAADQLVDLVRADRHLAGTELAAALGSADWMDTLDRLAALDPSSVGEGPVSSPRLPGPGRVAALLTELGAHPSITPPVAFVAGRLAGRAEAAARWRRDRRRWVRRP